MRNILFIFASPLVDSANQVTDSINDLNPSDYAIQMTVFFAVLIILALSLFFASRLIHASMLRSFSMNNQGQGAMEYLMTYGWAILVVMIVGVVLWELGVFNSGQGNPVETGFVRLNPLMPSVVYKNTIFNGTFVNNAGVPIRVMSVAMNETITRGNCTISPPSSPVMSGGVFNLAATVCPQVPTGAAYNIVVVITYNSSLAGYTTAHTETGYISGTAE